MLLLRIGKPPLESFSIRFNFNVIDEVKLRDLSEFVDSLQEIYSIPPRIILPLPQSFSMGAVPFTLRSKKMDRSVEIVQDYVLMQTQSYKSWEQERDIVVHVLESLKKHLGVSGISEVIMIYIDAFDLPSEGFSLSNWFNLYVNSPGWNLTYDDLHIGVSMKEEGMKTICKLRGLPKGNSSASYHFKLETLVITEQISHTKNPKELVDRMHDILIKRFKEVLTPETKRLIEMEGGQR